MRENGYLEFSCQSLEFSVNQGELIQDSFVIYAGSVDAEGDIYSSDTRMQVLTSHFGGEEAVIEYSFDGRCIEAGGTVKGYFTIISNQGEYTLAYQVMVQKPILQGSLGNIHNLFHFTNLAKSNWEEAVELFYSPEFINVFRKNEQHYISPYLGLSRIPGNVANVEEFFVEINKKTPIEYRTDVDGFAMEDILDTTQKNITITKSGWGYTDLSVDAEGEFLCVATNKLSNEDFVAGVCHLDFSVDATKLHSGRNIGKLLICDTRTQIVIPITIMMNRGNEKQEREKVVRRRSLELIKYYVAMKLRKITLEIWAEKSEQIIEEVIDIEPNNLLAKLYQVQILLRRERFQEAKWHLEQLDCEIAREESGTVARCYYFYLTTLFNRDENYMQTVLNEIETAYMNQDGEWRLAWLLIYMEDEYARGAEFKWHLLEEQFGRGCSSPVLLCEAVLLLQSHPKLLMKLGIFEQSVLWYAAKNHVLKGDVVEKLQYLAAREERFSQLLFRTLCEVYRVNKAPQTVAAICRMLILGEKVGVEYFEWYALGVALELRVTKLYEYYMMSIPMDYKEELPKMVLMYFAYQSNLDYEHNAFLYAYIVRNREKMPDLEQNYRIAIERFVIDQIKLGHINENLAYLYQNILAPQMLRDETAYAFTPLLFSHKIYVENAKITSVVVIHEKIHGESIYPVVNHVCVLPIYGDEYTILLQDAQGNRFTQSIPYENKRLMTPEKLLPFIGTYMEGRLSFDIYQCQVDKGFITITPENEKRFRVLSESEQVIDEFKKEIRGRLLRYYYDNDMIGEMDAFLEEIEATAMETEERAEFIRFMISRGMFEKAYQWLRCYGIAGVNLKPVARLVSRLIVTNQYLEEEFLVNVAYHVFSHTRYDENVLQYLMLYFNGLTVQLREIWKAARELDMDTTHIMHKMLEQMRFTNTFIQEKDTLLVEYSRASEHDEALVQECLRDTAYEYFVLDYVIDTVIFDMLYERYRQTGDIGVLFRLTLLKHWAENEKNREGIMRETIISFVEELLQRNICFEFYQNLVGIVPQLCCFVDKTFIEYKTQPGAKIKIHYLLDNDSQKDEKEYEVEEMPEMYNGIFVKAFSLFHDEVGGRGYRIGTSLSNVTKEITDMDGKYGSVVTINGTAYTISEKTTSDGLTENFASAAYIAGLVSDGDTVIVGTRTYVAAKMRDQATADGGIGVNDNSIITATRAYQLISRELTKASSIGADPGSEATARTKTPAPGAFKKGATQVAFTITEGEVATKQSLQLSLHVGSDADENNKISFNMETLTSAGLGVQGINVVDTTGAKGTYAIDAISDAIAKVSAQRSTLGAVQNRLEHTIKNLDNVVENTTAAESQIRDTDIAEEMVAHSKNNILAQAGQSMLAQANQSNQGALSLLG